MTRNPRWLTIAAILLVTVAVPGESRSPLSSIVLECGGDSVHNPSWPAMDTVHIAFQGCFATMADARTFANTMLVNQTTGVYSCPGCEIGVGCSKSATELSFGNTCTVTQVIGGHCGEGTKLFDVDCTLSFRWAVSCSACN
ncbi:MAG: hypothetical protein HZA52_03230 [Planctomycetes bacterium]|nr:hypothetical protein [Planctomycetota bacterium]